MAISFAGSYVDDGRKVRILFYFADTKEEAQDFIAESEAQPHGSPCKFTIPSEQFVSLEDDMPSKFWVIRKEECL